jgi:drug/metabolite transporter (DMT)-like permease
MSAIHRNPSALMGIGLVISAVASFALIDTINKHVSLYVPLLMVVWARYAVQAVLTTFIVLPKVGRQAWRTNHLSLQVIRGTLLVALSVLAVATLKVFPVAEFTAILMTTPLFVTFFAATMLKEKVTVWRVSLVIGGFIGTLVIVRPGQTELGWVLLLPLGIVIINTAFQLLTKRMSETEHSMTTHFYSVWVGAIVASLALAWIWTPVSDPTLWALLFLAGVAGTVGHYLLIKAYEHAPASLLMPYMYTQIGFALLGGWLAFGNIPDNTSLLGIALITVCGVAGGALTVIEKRQSKRRMA